MNMVSQMTTSEAINFTQHLLPDGRLHEIFIDRPREIAPEVWSATYEKANRIREAGYTFHAEMLSDYSTISLTSVGHHPDIDEENDVCILLAPNGPTTPEKVVELINQTEKQLIDWGVLNNAG